MEVNNVTVTGGTVAVQINAYYKDTNIDTMSPNFSLNKVAGFQVRVVLMRMDDPAKSSNRTRYQNLVFVRFFRYTYNSSSSKEYRLLLTSNELHIKKMGMRDDNSWHLVREGTNSYISFEIKAELELSVQPETAASNSFLEALHADSDHTDFELRGVDGGVHVHRVALAVASPVLRRMLSGAWREAAQGHVDVPDVTASTLQHLKDYIYLHKLPDSGLEQLMLLGSYYMMPELKQQCIDRLVGKVSVKNVTDMVELAMTHKMTRLLLAVLECVQSGAVDIKEMREQYERAEIEQSDVKQEQP